MEDSSGQRFLDIRINEHFQLRQRLGAGSFGLVYLGRDVHTGDEVAIKLEHCDIGISHLSQEIEIYEALRGRTGFPQVFWRGSQTEYQVMVFELLGPNLEDLFQYCGGRFSMKTSLMLMDQLLRRLECLHATGYLHRDIKPDNFLMGTGKRGNVVYLTDLGLATKRPARNDGLRPRDPARASRPMLIGTRRYASVNGHLDVVSSCHDDLESLGYMALYFLRGSLPWQGLRAPNREEKDRLVLEQKQQTDVEELCRDLPPEFGVYMGYLRDMKDPDRPDYAYLRTLFSGLFRRLGFAYDHVFDWTIREFERLSGAASKPAVRETSEEGQRRTRLRAGRRTANTVGK